MSRGLARDEVNAYELVGRVAGPGTPIAAMLEVADRCNERCLHCYQVQGQKGEMSTAELKRVIDELAELGVLFLTISGGEPTLRRDFLELVAYARELRFAVKVYTNGLRMTAALAQDLAALAVQSVEISVYSHRPEVHDEVTGVRGSFERTMEGIGYLVAAAVHTEIKAPLMKVNEAEYGELIALARRLGTSYRFDSAGMLPRENGDRAPEALSISRETQVRTSRDPDMGDLGPGRALPPTKPLTQRVCGACSGVHVEANGEVRPCTQLPVAVGDLRRQTVKEAFTSSTSDGVRDLTWGDVHGCRDCDLRSVCGRCHAKALAETGDALGPYEAACRYATAIYEAQSGRPVVLLPPVDAPRGTERGPYREVEPGIFRVIEDVITAADAALRSERPWVHRSGAPAGVPAAGQGGLVQIRRPPRGQGGGKAPRVDLVIAPGITPSSQRHPIAPAPPGARPPEGAKDLE